MWLTDLEKLTDPKYGLRVVFEPGWERRGASGGAQMKSVAGVLWHHDVAPRSGTYPLRNMLRDGRKGLTGPLCHIGFDRDGVVHVVGAGKANHAGTGSVPGIVRNGGNTRLIGVEMTSAGTKPWDWTEAQLRQMPRLGAALSDIFGLSSSHHWAHYEYSNGGKIDPAGLPGAMPGLRSRIAASKFPNVSTGGASAPAPSKPASKPAQKPSGKLAVDGRWGQATTRALQKRLGVAQDGRAGIGTFKALQRLLGAPYVDGKISRQSFKATELGNGIVPSAWGYTGRGSKGSQTIVLLQKRLGVSADGVVGSGTVRALQKSLNDGKF